MSNKTAGLNFNPLENQIPADFPKSYNPKEHEEKIYQLWQRSGFFNPDKLPSRHKKPFCVTIAPPNITGSLHMGHALENSLIDILIRQKRMAGYKTLWVPGIDHAGIATQNAVEKDLKKQGVSRHDLGREKFTTKAWEWKEKYGHLILDQLKKLGCSLDWSRTRFTLDDNYQTAVKTAFEHYYKKGWIYQGKRVINWCPRCSTSLSDLELSYKEEKGKLWYIKYPILRHPEGEARRNSRECEQKSLPPSEYSLLQRENEIPHTRNDKFIIVATTRPETMLGDTAVAVNPKDERYKDLIGQKLILPIANREIPIIADELVDKDFGTGAVKVTPAHDQTDFIIGQKHKLAIIQIIGENGRMTTEAGRDFTGLKVLEAREKIISELTKQNLLEKIEDYVHQMPHCQRCDNVIEPMISKQWFLKMDELAKLAIDAVKEKKIKIIPKKYEKQYFSWLANINDWCISRQLWWGHRLPVWYHEPKCIPRDGHEKDIDKCRGIKVSVEKPKCEHCDAKFVQSEDVLDTWFSSALWPMAVLGWPRKTNDLKTFFPTNLISSARDIFYLWIIRMIFSSLEFTKDIPFHAVYIHATILTKDGKRMSKSLGTGIDPLVLIEKHSSDAVRFGLTYQTMTNQEIHFSEDAILMGQKFANKIWNASRFVFGQIEKSDLNCLCERPEGAKQSRSITAVHSSCHGIARLDSARLASSLATLVPRKDMTSADKKIIKKLEETGASISQDLEKFRFGQAAHAIYDFFWHDFCDKYIEESKKQNTDSTKQILAYVLLNSLKLLHPFMPFVTEAIYQKLPFKREKLLMIERWPKT